ncbi:MAG: bacillithiol system redox-active protein YtxJ [Acidobacteria bacterium]|nr:bacillithiol system redox-active protein YtxJ [Acidobacteriota bacterium]
MTLRTLTNLDDLDAALARASTHPILIFKHSATCGVSAQAHEEIATLVGDAAWLIDVYVVSVQMGRGVSNEIARRLGLRHASPQVLLVQDGVVRWHASHFHVTAQEIRAAVQGDASGASAPTTSDRSWRHVLGAWVSARGLVVGLLVLLSDALG